MKRFTFICLVCLISYSLSAQPGLPISPELQNAYKKGTRAINGKPGLAYWQNTADYQLDIHFNPQTGLLEGTVDIDYSNHSPDTLKQIWFKLYPNLYQKGVKRDSKISEKDLGEGVKLASVIIGNKKYQDTALHIEGTNMYTAVPPVAPGQHVRVKIKYSYLVNKGSHVRTGRVDDGAWFIAYFFPRIAVYDDIDGWNKYPYTGDAEFYNDFCTFNAKITLPGNFSVWATGDLQNTAELFQPEIAERIALAEKSDQTIDVITEADVKSGKIGSGRESQTWNFKASHVPDFAFAVSDHYLWKSTSLVVDSISGRRTRVDAVFNASHQDYYEVIDFARKTVDAISFKFPIWPFPYSHITIFDGLDQMEYPMMVNDNPVDRREDAITLTVHEIFHSLFPFYMGTNETKHAWMDEGWATIGEWLIAPMIEPAMIDDYGIKPTGTTSGTKNDTPIMTLTPELKGSGSFTNSYPKPALGYLYVKDYLGNELFLKALHHYMEQWHGKHPVPADFFNSMNAGSGKNMDWFWKRWFYGKGELDLGISSATKTKDGYTFIVNNQSNKPLPIYLELEFADGSKTKIHQTIGIWEHADKQVRIPYQTNKKIRKVKLGDTYVPDKNQSNNTLTLK
ncbi:peptidase [Pedobacter antarcticus 4BY]|uniref:Peptidase n=2 Tax=Pedobacter antarcticus TaxID=34086 RepID=A0A081PD24_9SPHI|nr:M1 family metallopeptidase [Pedobacter antarcticus]KEQ28597.1 peptidase [Pedobacter antarcticus 4BY]SFE36657.1 hypothetical protein SAMN03003324_00229 [Pedobacter antarcticus]